MSVTDRKSQRARRHARIRKKISGTAECPRFCVSITTNNIYCQFIDDVSGRTVANTSSLSEKFKAQNAKPNMAGAELLGKLAAEAALAANITTVVFDRGGYVYTGRVEEVAAGAREAGLEF